MKLFKSGAAKAAPAGPAAANATAPPAALAAPVPAPKPQPAPAAAPVAAPAAAPMPAAAAPAAPEAAAAPMEPEMAAILDANVKEMSEKIARLSTSLEGAQNEKQHFEQKLEQMEERMRKLSALTEMISAQYNPFVGDAPSERDPLPSPEVGLAAPPMAAAPIPMPPASPAMPALALPTEAPDLDAQPLAAMPDFNPSPQPLPLGITMPPPFEAGEEQIDAGEAEEASPNDAQLWAVKPGFETSMLMLGWADMLLKNVPSRESLADLISYYHNIGWIGDLARDQLLAYADGIALASGPSGAADWRASLEVHEKSLLFLEKLKALNARGNGSRGR